METLIFSANAVLPIILLVLLGWVLKKIGLFTKEFLRVGNKLTFKVLLPVLLFYNVYQIESFSEVNWPFVIYGVAAIFTIFVIATVICMFFTKDNARRGVLIQAMFRSNFALIGIPLATLLYGEDGAATASVLAAFCVPLFNILAVATLSVFHKDDVNDVAQIVDTTAQNPAEETNLSATSPTKTVFKVKKVLLGIATNPLIWGVVAGLIALGIRALLDNIWQISFRLKDIEFLYTAIKYIANSATPVALLVLGGQFEFSSAKKLWKPVLFGTLMRTVVVSVSALVCAYILLPDLQGQHFAAYIALFGTPVAVGSAIMANEMGGDGELAGQLVVWTTIASAFTLFAIISVCKALQIL